MDLSLPCHMMTLNLASNDLTLPEDNAAKYRSIKKPKLPVHGLPSQKVSSR